MSEPTMADLRRELDQLRKAAQERDRCRAALDGLTLKHLADGSAYIVVPPDRIKIIERMMREES